MKVLQYEVCLMEWGFLPYGQMSSLEKQGIVMTLILCMRILPKSLYLGINPGEWKNENLGISKRVQHYVELKEKSKLKLLKNKTL